MGLTLLFVHFTLLTVQAGTCQESETKNKPKPTPTPVVKVIRESRPQRLGDIAWKIKLGGAAVTSDDEAIVLTNENVQQLAGERMLTERGQTAQGQPQAADPQLQQLTEDRERRRKHWRKLYDKQQEKVRKVEAELAMADVKVDSAVSAYRQARGSGAPEVKARAKLDEARGKRQVVAERLAREQSRLQTIIGQARRDGAQPGWFR
jgi:hypothetical protein